MGNTPVPGRIALYTETIHHNRKTKSSCRLFFAFCGFVDICFSAELTIFDNKVRWHR